MKPLLLAVLLVVGIPTTVLTHTDLPKLRDTICAYETRGEKDPDAARGQSDEIGRCQIRPSTARQMGYRGSLAVLTRPAINRAWALKYLLFCRRKLRTARVERLAHCYNGGPNAPWEPYGPSRRYAAAIKQLYQSQGGA